jgi:rubrerythrin
MKREFASLTPQEGLHVAIFIEERNAEIYQQFAELFAGFGDAASTEIAQIFLEMADEERRHGTELQRRYLERFGMQACSLTEDDLHDFIEVPRMLDGNIFAIARSQGTRPPRQQALRVALAAEQSALRYYVRLAQITKEPALRAFYQELAEFENEHNLELQRRLSEEEPAIGPAIA